MQRIKNNRIFVFNNNMTSMISYSIIIPNKNHPELLQRALNSIPARNDVEIIIIDDNSDPGAVDFTLYPGKNRDDCKIFFTKEGKGAGYARNIGIDNAIGKWLLFLDSDDFFCEGFLSLLDRHSQSDADIVFFDVTSVDSDTLLHTPRHEDKSEALARYKDRADMIDSYCRYHYFEPWGKMIRREMIVNNGIRFDETQCANDVMFSVLSGDAARTIEYDPGVLYCVTTRRQSLSEPLSENPAKASDRLSVKWRLQCFYDSHGIHAYYFYPFYRHCKALGGEASLRAERFVREQRISRVKLYFNCLRQIIRHKYRIGLPYCP